MDRIDITPDLSFSRISWGLMRSHEIEPGGLRSRLDACLAHGITTLDHADIYGGYRNEALLGGVFREAPGLRDSFEIVTKCGIQAPWGERDHLPVKHYDTSRDYIHAQVDHSLAKLGTDHVDLLLIHRPDPLMDADQTGRALDGLVGEGLVREVGASNFRPWDVSLLQSRMGAPIVANQIELSLGHTAPLFDGDLAFAYEHALLPMAWSPLGGGDVLGAPWLVERAEAKGCTPAQLALAFLLAHPSGIQPVVGTRDPARIGELAGAVDVELSRTEWFALLEAARGEPVP